jgi:hypothetical protein
MQGKTANLFAHSDAHFDDAKVESELSGGELPLMICWYWILKLKARVLLGDFAEALDAAEKNANIPLGLNWSHSAARLFLLLWPDGSCLLRRCLRRPAADLALATGGPR